MTYKGPPLSSIIKKMSRKDKKIVAKIFAKAMAKKYKKKGKKNKNWRKVKGFEL